jgi:hypothetical protein
MTQFLPAALFLHIQKTAGTSLVSAARSIYGKSFVSHGDCWGNSPSALSSKRFVSGHIGYDYASTLMQDRDFNFTFLRNPLERILSMYYFCKNRDPSEYVIYHKANTFSLEQFLEEGHRDPWIKKNIWNNQVWQLAHGYAHLDNRTIDAFSQDELLDLALQHMDKFHFIGITEQFENDGAYVLKTLGFPQECSIPRVNVTANRPSLDQQPAKILNLLESLTELDWKLYNYALSKRAA